MAAAISPQVKFTAFNAEWNPAAVTEDDRRDFSTTRTGSGFVFYNNHDVLRKPIDRYASRWDEKDFHRYILTFYFFSTVASLSKSSSCAVRRI